MKVKDFLTDNDFNTIKEKSEDSDYWNACLKFVSDLIDKNKDVEALTAKQRNWLDKIVDDCQDN